MKDLISVIVPVYNMEKYLDRCVESLINQTHKNLEIILIDDGSRDSSPQLCDDWASKDNRVKVIHKQNAGVSSARNDGIAVANGDFIAFIDSDDWIDETMYEKMIQKQKELDYDIVFAGYKLAYDEASYNVVEKSLPQFCESKDIKYLLRHENLRFENNVYSTENNVNCYTVRILYRKKSIGNLKFQENLNYMEDVRFLVELFLNKSLKIGLVEECLYNYYIRQSSLSHGKINDLQGKSTRFVESLTPVLEKTEHTNLINAEKFYAYYMCVANKLKSNSDDNIDIVKTWNTKENYKAHKTLCNGFASKMKAFLIHYKLTFVLKVLLKLKKR